MAIVPVSAFVDRLGQLTTDARLFLQSLAAVGGGGGTVTGVTGTAPIVSSGGTAPVISHAVSGVTAGTYGDATHVAQVTVNVTGHVTAAVDVPIAAAGVTTVSGTAPIASSGGATPAISLNDTAVTPGTYGDATHVAQVTVDQKGRLTFAQNVALPAASQWSVLTNGDVMSPELVFAGGDVVMLEF